ncbi:protein tyrosine phosphatase non-receptor type 13 [Cricetulus griseus]
MCGASGTSRRVPPLVPSLPSVPVVGCLVRRGWDARPAVSPKQRFPLPLPSPRVGAIHIYSLGMTLYWGADHEVPQSQPIKLGDHLNSILLGMCEDVIYARVSVRTVLDACSAHIRNSNCAPSFSYVKQLVKLVLGNISGTDQLSCSSEQKPDRSQAIRDRLRGKGLPTEPVRRYKTYHSDIFSTSSESPSIISLESDFRQVRRSEASKRFESSSGLPGVEEAGQGQSQKPRQYETSLEGNLISQEMMLKRQEEEMVQLQARMALRQSRLSLYPGDTVKASMLDISRDPLREIALETAMTQRKLRNFFGPEFVKMTIEPFISLDLPRSILNKKGKNEDHRRKVNIMLLSGQRLELTCDTKTICKDVFDMVVAHIGLVEHHLFALAILKENEYFFVDPDLKLTKVAPEGWKEEPKKKGKAAVDFTMFFRIKFFMDDVSLIQHSLTCHQYYLQLRKDILEERLHCDDEPSLLLASLALQAEYGDYQPEVHGMSYFRLEHYLPARVMEKLDLSYIKEELPKLHNTYAGASEKETELEFLKVCQRLTEYGVHFHRVHPEKKSQTGILLGVCSKGVLVFEVHNGVRTLVLRFPWRETKKISFSKKKITLQNTSDGIKHAFQTDSGKACQYLLHLCSSQHKFQLQMRARQSNQDAQNIERASFRSLNLQAESVRGFNMGRAISTGSLASSTLNKLAVRPLSVQAEILKRLSCSELSLYQPLQNSSKEKNDKASWEEKPRGISKSYHDLSQASLYPHRKQVINMDSLPPAFAELVEKPMYPMARSDTESLAGLTKLNNSKSVASLNRSPERRKHESDSSIEDPGQAYVVGMTLPSSGKSSSQVPFKDNDTLHKRWSVMSSPEREITLVNLKRDSKLGLGFQIIGGEKMGRLDLGVFISSVTPGGPADLDGCLKPGDRLISVNSVSLEGVSHHAAVDILQNAPEDVTLVISQPKEKPFKVPSTPVHVASGMKNYMKKPCYMQDGAPDPSEDQPWPRGTLRHITESPFGLSGGLREGSLSSQDSRTESASLSQSHVNGFFASHLSDRGWQDSQHGSPSQTVTSKVAEKIFSDGNQSKAKRPGISDTTELSDRGDSDIDDTASKQDHQTPKKVVHLLIEKGHSPTPKEPDPASAQCNPPGQDAQGDAPEKMVKKTAYVKDYSFVTEDNTFEVKLLKNSSGLGFSFSREDNLVPEQTNASIVRVKKLFPGQPAAESGKIDVGDVILKVNGASLKGLSQQEVISALRGTASEVSLLLCRPPPGVLPEIDTAFSTPLHSPAQVLLNSSKEPSQPPYSAEHSTTSNETETSGRNKEQRKCPSRRESSSDSSVSGEDDFTRASAKKPNVTLASALTPSLSNMVSQEHSQHEASRGQEEPKRTMFYFPQKMPSKLEFEDSRHPPLPLPDVSPGQMCQPQSQFDASDSVGKYYTHLAAELSKPENLTTLKNDLGNHLEDSELDPAKGDGRLKPGDRLIKVNDTDVTNMTHTDAVNLLRATPKVVRLIIGRILELPRMPVFPHLLPDITVTRHKEELGFSLSGGHGSPHEVVYISDINPRSVAAVEGNLQLLDIIHYVNGVSTQGMTLEEANRALDLSLPSVVLKATRDGCPVVPNSTRSAISAPKTTKANVVLKSNTIFQESGSQVDDIYADPQEAEVIQSLLDVVDEEAQNLLNQTNAARAACSPGHPFLTNEELAALPVVRVPPFGKYTGTQLQATIRTLQGLLDQGIPSQELQNLQELKPLDQCLIGQTKENRRKNRYKNILPLTVHDHDMDLLLWTFTDDTTRVPLGDEGGYINASFIRIPVGTQEFVYIACQGPLPTTVGDFWQMVWEQNSTVIAMMTQEVEGEKVKCQRYWPSILGTTTMANERLRLALLRMQQLKGFVVRVMSLEDIQTGAVRHITHLNFTAWPDHDTPSQPDDLLTFISYMRHIHRSGPVITHCSAGIGRSGTLICIDVVLGLISQDLEVSKDIAESTI